MRSQSAPQPSSVWRRRLPVGLYLGGVGGRSGGAGRLAPLRGPECGAGRLQLARQPLTVLPAPPLGLVQLRLLTVALQRPLVQLV